MGRLRQFFNRINIFRLGKRVSRPEDIPKKLEPDALEKAMREARFLHQHRVDVKSLQPGEWPGLPKRVD